MASQHVLWVSPSIEQESAFGYYGKALVDALRRTREVDIQLFQGPQMTGAKIAKEAEKFGADLIHVQYEPGLYSLGSIRSLPRGGEKRIPLIATVHRVASYPGKARSTSAGEKLSLLKEKVLAKRADVLLVHAQHSQAVLEARYPIATVGFHPMPVPPDSCNAPRPSKGHALYFGNHHPGKGVLDFALAMKALPDISGVVAGKQYPSWKKYNARVDEAIKGAKNIRMIDGWVPEPEKHKLFREASLVVLPYQVEGHGSAVLQDAIAHERPVVATDVEPLAECVASTGVGRVVPRGDVGALSDAIRRTWETDEEGVAAALRETRTRHCADAVAEMLVLHYRSLAESGRSLPRSTRTHAGN